MKGFGLDNKTIDGLNKDLALRRIQRDIQSDFIFAPHLNIVFHKAGDDLYDQLIGKLKAGKYTTRLPISIDVIKPNGFNRLGSILEPFDRLAYQLIVDIVSIPAERQIDREKVFSNKLLVDDPDGFMFEKAHESYGSFKSRITELCNSTAYKFALRSDVASYFDRLYQHVLGNLLYSSNADPNAVGFLEKFLLQLSQNDSHGIIQGVFPSDFLGNFCLCDIDAQHAMAGLEFARYVDDIYIFFKEVRNAKIHKVALSNWLRKDGLTLNESKTKIYKTEELLHEETELDVLFESARAEVLTKMLNIGYESNLFWDLDSDTEKTDSDVDIEAVKKLYDTTNVGEIRQKIERFCLPIFATLDDDYAVYETLLNYPENPSMSQIYFTYLSKMVRKVPEIVEEIEQIFNRDLLLFDYQRKWLYSALLFAENVSDGIIKLAVSDLQSQSKSAGLRSICAILIGKYGSAPMRQILKAHYSSENSEYVKSAILFAAQYFPSQQRDTCFMAWSGHSETNSLIVAAIKKK